MSTIVSLIVAIVGLAIASYFIAALQPPSLGTLANATKVGHAMVNVDATTTSLFNNYPLLIVLATFTAVAIIPLALLVKIKSTG